MNARPASRRGSLIVCVLACLLIASTIIASTTRSALQRRRNVHVEHQLRQTELLLDAGVLRAARQLRVSRDFVGETWRPAGAISRFDGARVEIRVAKNPQNDNLRDVVVIASLGNDVAGERSTPLVTRRTHAFHVDLSDTSYQTDGIKKIDPETDASNAE